MNMKNKKDEIIPKSEFDGLEKATKKFGFSKSNIEIIT
jgi:hypothetical protein